MNPSVSILVPVWNISNFIERCAHSLFQQTFTDIEYVFVNDCTPDDSMEKLIKIVNQYPQRKPFVKIINHNENKGLAVARNTAIDNSTGKYIQVVDGDDYIEPDMIELMYEKAEKSNADIVICAAFMETESQKKIIPSLLSNIREKQFEDMLEKKVGINLWNKLVLRQLYEMPENRVPEGLNIFEDQHVSYRLFFCAKNIVQIQKPLYHYVRYNPNALSKQKTDMLIQNYIQFWLLLDKFLIEKNKYDEYRHQIELQKITGKMDIFFQIPSVTFYKQYAWLFRDLEMGYIHYLQLGKRLILFFTHYKMYTLAKLIQSLIVLKNKKFLISFLK